MKSYLATPKVFVYGTLKPGEANYQAYCKGKVISQVPGYTWGNLYDLPLGYPALTRGENKVTGVLLTFNNSQILNTLDRLEGYQEQRASDLNEYERKLALIYGLDDQPLEQAWVYFMRISKVRQYGGTALISGCWTGLK